MWKPHRRSSRPLYFAFAIGLALAHPARATVVLPADFSTMVSESETIVHGRVAEVRSQMRTDRRSIESLVTVAVIDSLKGGSNRLVVFRTPAGQVGRYRRIVVGAPEFEPGDEVVVFLHGSGPMLPTVFGLNQGVYRVKRSGDLALVTPAPVVGDRAAAARVVRGDPARRPMPIDEFVRQVRTIAAEPR